MNEKTKKQTQKQRLLEALKSGRPVTQINLNRYLSLLENKHDYNNFTIDAIAELGIANLPARIFNLRKEGYDIKTIKVQCKGRFCNTYYFEYYLAE